MSDHLEWDITSPLYMQKKENHFCLQKNKCIVILNQQEVSGAIHTHIYTDHTGSLSLSLSCTLSLC